MLWSGCSLCIACTETNKAPCCREVKPHRLVSATAVKNRVILMSISANGRQWRKSSDKLRHMWKSLRVVAV